MGVTEFELVPLWQIGYENPENRQVTQDFRSLIAAPDLATALLVAEKTYSSVSSLPPVHKVERVGQAWMPKKVWE